MLGLQGGGAPKMPSCSSALASYDNDLRYSGLTQLVQLKQAYESLRLMT